MFVGAAAFAQESPDTVVSSGVPGVIAEEEVFDTAVVQELPGIAVEEELPDTVAVRELPQPAAAANQGKPDTAAAKDLPNIAVYVTGNVKEDEKKALGTRMLASLVNSGRYRGIERSASFLDEIDKEHIKQRSGAIDDDQISKLGKQFGVKYVCIADITPAYGEFQVSARIIDVETAVVAFIGESTSRLKTIDDLTNVSDRVVRRMFGLPEPPEEAQPLWKRLGIKFSAGAGGFYAGNFDGGIKWGNKERVAMPYSGGGLYIFVDATYMEVFAGYSEGGGKWQSANAPDKKDLPDMQRAYAHGGLFLKYPFNFKRVKVYPLLGAEYEYCMSGALKYDNLAGEYKFDGKEGRLGKNAINAPWGKFGGGVDFALGQNLYMRSEFLYGVRTTNWLERHYPAEAGDYDAKGNYGHGLTMKIGVGLNF